MTPLPRSPAQFDMVIKERGAVAQTRLAMGNNRRVVLHNKITERNRDGIEVIHQFHPLIGFVAADLRERQEQDFPLVAVRLSQEDAPKGVTTGDHAFYVMQWSFAGVQ